LKYGTRKLPDEEPLYVFTIHAGSGIVGMILTGIFAR
jgi:ammonia channel protein AmtB